MSRFLRLPIRLRSLPILIAAGFLGGAVMALQMTRALAQWGQAGLLSAAVSSTVMRELGPVLTGLIVAWRFAFGIAREQRAPEGAQHGPASDRHDSIPTAADIDHKCVGDDWRMAG